MFVIPVLAVAMFSSCLYKGIKEGQTYQEEMVYLSIYLRDIESQGYDVDTTELGVFYYVREIGDGIYPKIDDTLTIKYVGYLINGDRFYPPGDVTETVEVSYVLGQEDAIKGWNDGLKVIRKGSTVELIIPSPLGFGSKWNGDIPPNNTLVYVITMVDIKQKK